jgi:mono/diheme cytochrome c family protein
LTLRWIWLFAPLAGDDPDGLATCARRDDPASCVIHHGPRDALPPVPPLPADASPELQHGAWLYRVADCVGCHSPPYADATHLGGGRILPTVFGTFYAPNISPHPEHGIGRWTEEDFFRAMRHGRAPDGHAYWPTFPYMAYTQLTDDDLRALWAYLRSQPPVAGVTPPHELAKGYRSPGLLGLWRMLAFRPGPPPEEPDRDATWHRGRYLVHAVAYCDQCHTPRTSTGLLRQRHLMAGGENPAKGQLHPNLTPHPEAGIGRWSAEELARFLETGVKPDGSLTDPDQMMLEKIRDSSAWLSEEDRLAIAAYLRSLPSDDLTPR